MFFTISGICVIFAGTLILILQNYSELFLCPVVWIIAIHLCMVSRTLTSPNFNVFWIDWPAWWQSHLHLLVVFHCFVPFVGCQENLEYCSRFRMLLKFSFLIYKTRHEKQPVYLHSVLATSLPSRSPRSNKESVCRFLGWRLTQVQELFALVPHLFGLSCRCLSAQPSQLLPSRNISRHISLSWPFPHRQWHVDVTELLHQFCCWTPIQLLRYWAWLCRDISAIESW